MAHPASISRRSFLTGRAAQPVPDIAPPGVVEGWTAACSGCGACAGACPTGIILMRDGRPSLDFSAGECLFCGDCAEACPEPVFDRAAKPAFTHVVAVSDTCLARNGVSCMSCRDACPEAAISFRPRVGGPFVPVLAEDSCTGCGACIATCPVRAIAVAPGSREAGHG
ncbi:ferredoxin-type protein NapF [Mesorhizobium sp. L-8-3]|uniref:ferredoxin-type protein NapF n=1 Tax=Mesorhizobium sp. L-8-3 TaxID=2744522 RepID=UPI001926DB37|nr:ferredoxin-type protein NapF [Mesorhizobium sp. L-8-3]BCH24326.1 ferredoxin-type protein NapF [Mesorhizobium sp. L-8-3]